MATINLNPQLQIRIYYGFAIIPDLRQTGIAKKPGHFQEKITVNFSLCPVNLFAKRIRFLPPLGFL